MDGIKVRHIEFTRADAVWGNLETVFEKRDAPTGHNHFPQSLVAVFQVAIPLFEMVSSRMVRTNPPSEFDGNQRNEKGNDISGNARRPEIADINRAFHILIEYEPVACLKKRWRRKTPACAGGMGEESI